MEEVTKRLLEEERKNLLNEMEHSARWMVKNLDRRISHAAKYDVMTRASERVLARAREHLDREQWQKAFDAGFDGVKKLEKEMAEGAEAALLMEKAKGMLERGRQKKLDTGKAEMMLAQAEGASSPNSRLYFLKNCIKELGEAIESTDTIYDLVRQLTEKIRLHEGRGRDVSQARECLEKAKLATQHESAIHFLKKGIDYLERCESD